MKKTTKPAFSNGTELMMFEDYNCDKCIKASHYIEEEIRYTQWRCAIQREIVEQVGIDAPISERTYNVCNDFTMRGITCPFIKTERKKYAKKNKKPIYTDSLEIEQNGDHTEITLDNVERYFLVDGNCNECALREQCETEDPGVYLQPVNIPCRAGKVWRRMLIFFGRTDIHKLIQ